MNRMPGWDDDEKLALQYAADGEGRALETLYRRHIEATYAFSKRFLNSREDAEEATSECWLRAFRALRNGQYRGQSSFKTWIFGIARYVCFERLRQPRLPTMSLTALSGEDRGDWTLFAGAPPEVSKLDEALASLTDDHRLILTLCDLQGFTAAEAASIIGRTTAAAKSLHIRARRALRDRLVENENLL